MLTELEARVAAANLDVKTATIRLAESRFQRGVAASALLPSVNADAKYQYELYSQNGIAGLLTKLVPASTSTTPLTIPAISDWTVGFDASWELDLWGHVRRSVESADAQVDQSAEMRRDTLVSSLAELARDYVQLRGAQTQIAIANENLAIAREIQKVAEERQRKGVATGFDAQTSTAQAESVSARIPTLRSDESQYSNAIGFLLDEPPGALQSALGPRKRALAPPGVPSLGVPSELARRRPDIRAAEAQLHAATADIGVAVAAFYPTIKLNGVVSLDALDAKNLFKASSLQYNAGPSVSLPIFDAGRLKSTLELRKAEQVEAAIAWHKTVLQAWREVVDALTAYRREAERRARTEAANGALAPGARHRALALQDRRRPIFGCARRRAELSPGGAGLRDQHDQCLARSRHALQGAGRGMGGDFSGRAGGAGARGVFAVLDGANPSPVCGRRRGRRHIQHLKKASANPSPRGRGRRLRGAFPAAKRSGGVRIRAVSPKALAGFASESL